MPPWAGDVNGPGKKQHLFDNPRNVSRLARGLYVVCILLILLEFIVHRHIALEWESFPGFYALYGFIAYTIIVFTASQLRKILKRSEDYYDVDE